MAGQAGLSRLGAVTFLLVITINLREDPHRGGCGGGELGVCRRRGGKDRVEGRLRER